MPGEDSGKKITNLLHRSGLFGAENSAQKADDISAAQKTSAQEGLAFAQVQNLIASIDARVSRPLIQMITMNKANTGAKNAQVNLEAKEVVEEFFQTTETIVSGDQKTASEVTVPHNANEVEEEIDSDTSYSSGPP
ncbi:Uncharacterised protein [Legionella lansingensis]|uniref:Uncharacterized protein n=1 Tax=Legionella lansingensis TaxID=45067 RepID=Q49J82_9GAMM|nr:hypothetical protein [Legionella lansingensis]AAX56194.1 unknown [Legionella lansingensis]KTD19367.1 hypothetical protein Llan_2105 [Legionella lansingensis]SNV53422.1 Uncharacterised protein [Legionella lansingensis]